MAEVGACSSLREIAALYWKLKSPTDRSRENRLSRGDRAIFCSAFVQHLYQHAANIDFAPDEGEAIRLPKVRIKFAYDPGSYKQIRKNMRWDAARKGASEPVLRPQDRYGCSDKRLFRYLDSSVTVAVTTLEGEVFTGKVAWMGRWEFGLKLEKSEVEVVFWRHALADIAEDK